MVELVDTQVSEACGRKAVEVQILSRAPVELIGAEVRFLRKHLGYSGTMFAKLIGYDEEPEFPPI